MRNTSYEEYFPLELREIFDDMNKGVLGDPNQFKDLLNTITNKNDYYLVGTDFKDYVN